MNSLCFDVSVKLELVPVTLATLQAEQRSDMAMLRSLLDAVVAEWPPAGGEWDADAVNLFLGAIASPGHDASFAPHYVLELGHGVRTLVASAGFFGGPDPNNEVEIGYSVCANQRRRGVATAVVGELMKIALLRGANSVRARTTTTNVGSIRALQSNGFVAGAPEPAGGGAFEQQMFRRLLGPS